MPRVKYFDHLVSVISRLLLKISDKKALEDNRPFLSKSPKLVRLDQNKVKGSHHRKTIVKNFLTMLSFSKRSCIKVCNWFSLSSFILHQFLSNKFFTLDVCSMGFLLVTKQLGRM